MCCWLLEGQGVAGVMRRPRTERSVLTAASPRNQLYRHKQVARFWRPACFLGGSQHRGQVPSQLDPELAPLRRQDDRINQSTEHLRRFQACILALERRGEILDLRSVEVSHARVKQRCRLVGGFDLRVEDVSAMADGEELVLNLTGRPA